MSFYFMRTSVQIYFFLSTYHFFIYLLFNNDDRMTNILEERKILRINCHVLFLQKKDRVLGTYSILTCVCLYIYMDLGLGKIII